jgi:hypothetical protein
MRRTYFIAAAAVLLVGLATPPADAQQGRRAAEMARLHALCEQNYKPACIRFGIMIGQNQVRWADWRREHPNWWWWERY